jgi:hypothetical protein
MPLAELDANLQHQREPRGKRMHAAGPARNENLFASHMAPTKAFVAKNAPPPATERPRGQLHSGRNTPQSQAQNSKIPRRNAATPTPKPAYSPPISKWNLSATENLTAQPIKTVKTLQASPCPPTSRRTGYDQSLVREEVLDEWLGPLTHSTQIAREPSATTHRAQVEKPLPSRPIATLVCAPSPSRNSRTLIDASERPLRLSIAGLERDWPTLKPTSHSTPTLIDTSSSYDSMPQSKKIPAWLSSSALLTSSLSEVTLADETSSQGYRDISGFDSSSPNMARSSMVSDISSSEIVNASKHSETGGQSIQHQTQDVAAPGKNIAHPPRKSSLTSPDSSTSPIERSQSTGSDVSESSGFARATFNSSRPYSPSHAKFSRPRPTSLSQIASTLSTPTATSHITPVRSQKTASSIPLPDQKKATLVDIRGRRVSGIPVPKSDQGLSFGGRRIDSPDPLKVLDHGIKRRQLQRANTGGSNSTASTVPTRFLGNGTPPVDRSKANTPDSTMGSSSEEEEEITTPSDRPTHFTKHGYVSRSSGSHYAGATLKVYDEAEVILGRPPPSNSPFTGHLQTIPSQSTLPLRTLSDRDSLETEPRPKVVIKPTEFSTFAHRLSMLEDSHHLFTSDRYSLESPIGADTKSELVDILREAEHEDALISQCGAQGLDVETKERITSTLGMLEGRCGPANTTVDLDHLSRMFGVLKTGLDRAPKSAAFVEDVTVAERFLARRESTASDAHKYLLGKKPPTAFKDDDTASQLSRSKTVASKWSTSTASAKEHPLPFTDTSSSRQNTLFEEISPALPPKHLANGNLRSIGYPSTGKAHRVLGTGQQDDGAQKTAARRVSSPTLGARIPGSVRAAREKARDSAGSRVNKTSTNKAEKLPTPNTKVFKVSKDPPRERLPFAEKLGPRASTKVIRRILRSHQMYKANVVNQLPRSRSKSRYVFDKLNGLFTGRRDKCNSQVPPLPPVKDSFDHEMLLPTREEVRINSLGSPMLKESRAPPLTKMPTISPPVDDVHPALRSDPSTASVAHGATTIGSNADYEGRRPLQALSEKLVGRAQQEDDAAKKERLLNFAKVSLRSRFLRSDQSNA